MYDPFEIAAWRFEQIAPLIDPSLDRAQRTNMLRERSTHSVVWPQSKTRRRHGHPGLLPKRRSDRGSPRDLTLETWVSYAIGLLYEQPYRSLTQIEKYLRLEFADYDITRSTLDRHLRAHSAFHGIKNLRKGTKSRRLRNLYEAQRPHECWQLDGKGPFRVSLKDGGQRDVHVLSILDDYSRAILACVISTTENAQGTIRLMQKAVGDYGIPDRFQFDRGSAFDSHAFRGGIARLGVHRNHVKARNPEAQGKIEAYHRSLKKWFVWELRAQEVIDLEHLEQLLQAMIALLYNRHHHRIIGTTPKKRLADCTSARRVSKNDVSRAFFLTTTAKSHKKTGQVQLPNGSFRVPRPHAGIRGTFLYDPVGTKTAFLVTDSDHEVKLEPFRTLPLSSIPPSKPKRGTGQLQKLVDVWQGKERPNAQPGFGLPEIFQRLGDMLGRSMPASEREGRDVGAFYRKYGPLERTAFEKALRRSHDTLGKGRPLSEWLNHLERQIQSYRAEDTNTNTTEENES